MLKRLLVVAFFATLATSASALTHTVVGAATVTSSNTSNSSDADHMIDQSGLSVGYTSGVTDFDLYFLDPPMHSPLLGGEWFSNSEFNGGATATLTFDLGAALTLDGIAIWNEESRGIGSAVLSASSDGVAFTPLATLTVASTPAAADYPAEIFDFSATTLRFLRMEVADCGTTGSNGGIADGCSLGEVAFRATSAVPVPASALLLVTAFAGFRLRRRNRAQ